MGEQNEITNDRLPAGDLQEVNQQWCVDECMDVYLMNLLEINTLLYCYKYYYFYNNNNYYFYYYHCIV